MANKRKIQLETEVTSAGVRKGVDEIKTAVRDMGAAVVKEAEKAAKGVEGIGAGGDKAARELERSDARVIASIQRRTAAVEAAGKGERAFQEALIRNRGGDVERFKPYLDQLSAADRAQKVASGSLDKMGVSAKQTAAALRGVPAQFTDIFTSLQGGQAPLTVLLQQGGQLKDMFGGVGNAARAMGGYVLGLINPFTLAAAAAGVLVFGYSKGAQEATEFTRTLVLTGNAAGTTAGQLALAAQAVATITGATTGRAAEVLNAIAASGAVGANNLTRLAAAAIALERVGGPAAEKTAQAFADLAKSPLQAALKLNEATNFLTESTYKQIKALDDQGRSVDAARLAQEAYAGAIEQRAPEIIAKLGLVERAWIGVRDAGKSAGDAVADIGRGGVDKDIAGLQSQISILRRLGQGGGLLGVAADIGIKTLQEQLTLTSRRAVLELEVAAAQAESVKQVKALTEFDKERDKLLDKRTQGEREIERFTNLAVAAGLKRKDIEAEILAIRVKYADKAGDSKAQREREAEIKLLNELAGTTADYTEDVQRLVRLRQQGTLSERQYLDALNALIARQPFAKAQAKDQETALKSHAKAMEEAGKAYDKYLAGLDKGVESHEQQVQGLRDQYIELTAGKTVLDALVLTRREDALATAEQALQSAYYAEAGDAEYQRRLTIIESLKAEIALRKGISTAAANAEVGKANEKAAQDSVRYWQRAGEQIEGIVSQAIFDGGKSGADLLEDLFRTLVLRPVVSAAVQGGISFLSGLAGQPNAASGQGANGLNTAGNLATLYGYGEKTYAYAAGLFGTGAAGYTTVAGAGAASAGLSSAELAALYGAEGYGATAGAAAGTSAAAGAAPAASFSWAGYAAVAIIAAMQADADYKAGFNRDSVQSAPLDSGRPLGLVADLFSGAGLNDGWADILSGSTGWARVFGRAAPQVQRAGVQGTFGAGDFSGQTFADIKEKGGFLRSDKNYTQTAEITSDLDAFFDAAAKSVYDKAKDYAAALGLPADALGNITKQIKVELGDDAEKNKAAIIDVLGGYGEALVAGYAASVAPLAQYGETTIQTIERVGMAIKSTNDVLAVLGLTALQTSVSGGKAALELSALFGGVEGLQQSASTYYQQFFTEAERSAGATQQITKALAEVGLALPGTREQFRGLVEGLDLTTAAGQKQFGTLLSLSGAFADLVPATESAAEVAKKLLESERQLADERAGLQRQLLEAQGDTAAIRELERAALGESNRGLYDQIKALEDLKATTLAGAEAAEAIARRQGAINEERAGLERQILELQGNSSAIRALERAALDDSNRALYDQVKALQDQGAAADAAAQAAERATTAQTVIANERAGLERQLLQLQGDTAALRALERAGLDATNRALYDRVTGLQDEQTAQAQAARAAQDAIQAASESAKVMERLAATFEQAVTGLASGVQSAFQGVESTVGAQRQKVVSESDAELGRLNGQADAARSAFASIEAALGGLVDSLDRNVAELLGTLDKTSGRAQALATLNDALQAARAGRGIDVEAVTSAAAVVSRPDSSRFSSAVEFQRDTLRTAALLSDLSTAARGQLGDERASTGEQLQSIAAAIAAEQASREAQLVGLDTQLDLARKQYEALTGIDTSVLTVDQSIRVLGTAFSAYAAATGRGGAPTNQFLRAGDTEAYLSSTGAVATRAVGAGAADTFIRGLSGSVFSAAGAREWVLAMLAGGHYKEIRDRAVLEGIDSSGLDDILGEPRGTSLAFALSHGLPAFAAGTAYVPSTGPAVVHEGERIITATDNQALMRVLQGAGRDVSLVAEIRSLRAELAKLREDTNTGNATVAANTRKSAQVLDQWNSDGLPVERT